MTGTAAPARELATRGGETVRAFWTKLEDEAAAWSLPRGAGPALFLLPLVGAPLVVASRVDKSLFLAITDEDRLLEWLQFFGFAAASVLAALCAVRLRARGRGWLALAYLVFAIGCFGIAGEEIAWGQRIFGFGTPEALEKINEQEEVTVHNINSVQNVANLVFLLAGLYGSVGAWLIRRRLRGRRSETVDYLVPPLFLTAAFFVVFVYKIVRAAVLTESGFTITQIGEWPEFCLALGFSAFAFVVLRRLTFGWSGSHGPDSSIAWEHPRGLERGAD